MKAGRSASAIEALARVAKAKPEATGISLNLVVVDHIHKMHHPGFASKVQELTEISAGLAEMAKRLQVPVLALAQLNRSLEGSGAECGQDLPATGRVPRVAPQGSSRSHRDLGRRQVVAVVRPEPVGPPLDGDKGKASFCGVTQDGDEEGVLRLDRLPTRAEAAAIRKALGIRQSGPSPANAFQSSSANEGFRAPRPAEAPLAGTNSLGRLPRR